MYARKQVHRAVANAEAPVSVWPRLSRNDRVEIHPPGHAPVAGTIDMIAADRSVFWMIRHDGFGRTMICSGDEVVVVKLASDDRQTRARAAA